MGAAEDERLDRDLVEQAQRGDREAFAILARTHGDRLMAIAQRILRDVGRAEDAVQQTLVIAWRELPGLRDPDRFDAWLQRLLVNASYAEARRSRTWNANVRVLPGRRAGRTRRVRCRSTTGTASSAASDGSRPTSGRSSSSPTTWA